MIYTSSSSIKDTRPFSRNQRLMRKDIILVSKAGPGCILSTSTRRQARALAVTRSGVIGEVTRHSLSAQGWSLPTTPTPPSPARHFWANGDTIFLSRQSSIFPCFLSYLQLFMKRRGGKRLCEISERHEGGALPGRRDDFTCCIYLAFSGVYHWRVPKYMAGEGILYAFWGDLFAFSAL